MNCFALVYFSLLLQEDKERADKQPRVTIHTAASHEAHADGSADAYIINGAETNIAAGSGLRALRWLRS
jgi:hypothetical protein